MSEGDVYSLSSSPSLESALVNQEAFGSAAEQYQANVRMLNDVQGFTSVEAPITTAGVPELTLVADAAQATAATTDMGPSYLDKNKSVSQLINEGAIRRSEVAAPNNIADAGEVGTGKVTVTYSDAAQGTPDIIVRKDGSIEATGDFEASAKTNLVVQVEREPGNLADPQGAQKQALNGVVDYLHGRLSQNPALAGQALKLDDQFGLVGDGTASKFHSAQDAAAEDADHRKNFSPETKNALSRMSRMTPSSSGSMSSSEIDNQFPTREVPTLPGETDSVLDSKNAVAALFNPDKAAPYETVRTGNDGQVAVGRYGMTYPIFHNFFKPFGDESLDEANAPAVMDKLASAGKISKDFAAKFKDAEFTKGFVAFMNKLKNGEKPSAEEMKKFMPKDLQEQIAMDTVNNYSKLANGDIGKVALGFHLGKSPDQLSAADLADKGNQEFMQSANKLAQLSANRRNMGDGDTLNWSVGENGSSIDAKILKAAFGQANEMSTSGRCAEGVQIGWAEAGYGKLMGKGDGWQMRHALLNNKDFVLTDYQGAKNAAQDGNAIITTRRWAFDSNGAGHVATLGWKNGKMMEASDHVNPFNPNNSRYDKSLYFVYVGDRNKKST
jgi:hypothetical protein